MRARPRYAPIAASTRCLETRHVISAISFSAACTSTTSLAERSRRDGDPRNMPRWLRRLLHCAINLSVCVATRWEASRCALSASDERPPLRVVRSPRTTSDLRFASATTGDVRRVRGRGDGDVDRVGEADSPRFDVEPRWLTAEPFTAWASVTLDPCTTFC
jgi:hypothetical protein